MITGVGPIVTGLMKLFGSSEPNLCPHWKSFKLPSSVSVEAGLISRTGDSVASDMRRAAPGDGGQVVGSARNERKPQDQPFR